MVQKILLGDTTPQMSRGIIAEASFKQMLERWIIKTVKAHIFNIISRPRLKTKMNTQLCRENR